MKKASATDKYFSKVRAKLNKQSPSYFDPKLLNKVESLILAGKANIEIYDILNLEYNSRNANMIARTRQKMKIFDFNPNGISMDIQDCILTDMINGLTNKDIEIKYRLNRSKYVINMLARLRQKVKKLTLCESSTTIEKI